MGLLVGESDSKGNGFSREQNGMICVMTGCNLCFFFFLSFILGLGFDSFHLIVFFFRPAFAVASTGQQYLHPCHFVLILTMMVLAYCI